jgi:hypothetical protein
MRMGLENTLTDLEVTKRTLSGTPLSTESVARKAGLKRVRAFKRLIKLEKQNEVMWIGRVALTRSILWDLKKEVGKSAQTARHQKGPRDR